MTTAQKLAIENGDPTICGAPNYTCDFDATGVPTTMPPIPPFKMRDGPRGAHNLAGGPTTTWAVAEARAASFDDNLEFLVGQVQAQEMRALKFDLSLAPSTTRSTRVDIPSSGALSIIARHFRRASRRAVRFLFRGAFSKLSKLTSAWPRGAELCTSVLRCTSLRKMSGRTTVKRPILLSATHIV